MELLTAAFLGLVSATFMTLTEFPFWRKWGMRGVAEWQINWVTLTVLGIISYQSGDADPQASWKVILSHLIHGMVAGIGFVLLLPPLLAWLPVARAWILLDAVAYSLVLWILFTVALKRLFEWVRGIRIIPRGMLVSLLSHSVYGLSLGLLVGSLLATF